MVTAEQRAYLINLVHREVGTIAEEISSVLATMSSPPDNHRISTLINTLAWHADDTVQTGDAMQRRLTTLRNAVQRLHKRLQEAGSSEEAALYALLLDKLPFEPCSEEAIPAERWCIPIPDDLILDEEQQWKQQANLLVAQTTLHLLTLLVRSWELRDNITRQGAIQWQ